MLVCTGHPAIDLDRWYSKGLISPGPRLLESGGGGRGRLKRASGGAEQRAHGDHRWRRKTLVVPVVLAVHPMWTDQSRQLIIRLLEPI